MNFDFRKQINNYETLTSFLNSQVSYFLKNASQSDAENEFQKYTKMLKIYKWTNNSIQVPKVVKGGETNFRVNFGTSDNCPISEALARALLIGSGIFWNGVPEKCPDPAI